MPHVLALSWSLIYLTFSLCSSLSRARVAQTLSVPLAGGSLPQSHTSSISSNGAGQAGQQQAAARAATAGSWGGPASRSSTYDEDTVEGIQMNPQKTIAAGLNVRVSTGSSVCAL